MDKIKEKIKLQLLSIDCSPYSPNIFLYSVRIQEITDQKKLRIWTLFTQYLCCIFPDLIKKMVKNKCHFHK